MDVIDFQCRIKRDIFYYDINKMNHIVIHYVRKFLETRILFEFYRRM